jgi:hypothetical protein
MNFEFKSTFNKINVDSLIQSLQQKHHTFWIIAINSSSTAVMLALYFSDAILPAVIASQPHGNLYVLLLECLVIAQAASSTYAVAFVLFRRLRIPLTYTRQFATDLMLLARWYIKRKAFARTTTKRL